MENLSAVVSEIEICTADLRDAGVADTACRDREVVFHLAADHGGRGYVDLHQVACSANFALDQAVFSASLKQGVQKVVYASSGCVYPNHLQGSVDSELYLTEEVVGPPYEPDGIYGLAKLAGELTLQAMNREHGLASVSCRYFTVYGPRGVENHAVMAMIGRAFTRQDPFVVWGTGQQIRNWTYVSDIVSGTLAAAERLDDSSAVNLGTMERIRVIDAVELTCEYANYRPSFEFHPEMPIGPLNRVADNGYARRGLDWKPAVDFREGLCRTMDWYFATRDQDDVRRRLEVLLTERPSALVG